MASTQPGMVPAKGVGPDWPTWLEGLYQLADDLDAAGFASRFGPQGSMRFGNAPVLVGSDAIEGALDEFFGAVTSMCHRPLKFWENGADVIFEAVVTYGRGDGKLVEIPAVTAYTRTKDDALHCRIFCDMAPVFSDQ